MKTSKYVFVALAAIGISTAASALDLDVDKAHSTIGFDIKHLMISSVHGNFGDFSGTVNLDEKKLENSKISFKVNASSINTNNEKRDGHLKSADFFDAAKYPEATFQSTSVKAASKGTYVLEGDLTIHGITKRAKFQMSYLGKNKDPFTKAEKYVFHATTKIVRKDYGLTYNAALESGGVLIGDTADLVVDLEAAPHQEQTAQTQ